jgi:hypothetical protein
MGDLPKGQRLHGGHEGVEDVVSSDRHGLQVLDGLVPLLGVAGLEVQQPLQLVLLLLVGGADQLGDGRLGLVIVAGAIRIASLCLGIQTSLTVELIVSAIAAVIVGGYGGSEYLKRVKRDG